MKKYRPSNGTEGEMFMEQFCYQCTHDHVDGPYCDIIARTMAFDADDPEYPEEWIMNDNFADAKCTKFKQR